MLNHQGNTNQNHNEIHLTPVKMAKMNNSGNNRCWQGCGGETLLHCWERKLVQLLWKMVWRFLKKLKIELSYDPVIALLGIYPKDTEVQFWRGTFHPNVFGSTINNSQSMERAQMSINSRMDKEDVAYTYTMDYYLAIKKNEILPFATVWMKLQCIMLREISQKKINIWFHSYVELKRQNRWT